MEKKKDFERIYEELYEENNEILMEAKKQRNKRSGITFFICFLICMLMYIFLEQKIMMLYIVAIAIIIMIIVYDNENKKFKRKFKEIIGKLVKKCNSRLIFEPSKGISIIDYKESKFDNMVDKLFSEDKIHGTLEDGVEFSMAQVVTKMICTKKDEKGKILEKEEKQTFKGIFGKVILPNSIDTKICITNNNLAQKYHFNRIEMDSAEFEESFDCLAKDKMKAMKIFTSDLLEKFVNLKKGKLTPLLLKIENDVIYFRIECGECFEPPKIKFALDKEVIQKCYNIIFLTTDIIEEIVDNIKLL